MPINFSASDGARILSQSGVERSAIEESTPDGKMFVYKHMYNGSGICPECAPWLNMLTSGDGSDAVPVPPLHPRCKCFLMPALSAVASNLISSSDADSDRLWDEHFDWLENLSYEKMVRVLGRVRARLVKEGSAKVRDLYEGRRLKLLDEMGLGRDGVPLGVVDKAKTLLSHPAFEGKVRDFHIKYYARLPRTLRGKNPGDARILKVLVAKGLAAMGRGRVKSPSWLVLLVELLRESAPSSEL